MNLQDWHEKLSRGRIVPYFQPITATDDAGVFGHEALGRIFPEGADPREEPESLGPFFGSRPGEHAGRAEKDAFADLMRDTDRRVRRAALERFARHGGAGKLFLNIRPSLMMAHLASSPQELPFTVGAVRELGVDPRRVVMEITEEGIHSEPEDLLALVELYRREGFLIALDDVGSASSNLDRLGFFKPDIIKIDIRLLKMSAEKDAVEFRTILDILAVLAERMGSDLLFEGVENAADFQNALFYGARYIQGFLLSRAEADFARPDAFLTVMMRHRELFYWQRYGRALGRRKAEEAVGDLARSMGLEACAGEAELEARIRDSLGRMEAKPPRLVRFYATDLMGVQITPNCIVEGTDLRRDEGALGRSWCFRPYFFHHVEGYLRDPETWTVSAPYRDISLKIPLRTAARRCGERILFLDFIVEGED